jgi:hypothetical protein
MKDEFRGRGARDRPHIQHSTLNTQHSTLSISGQRNDPRLNANENGPAFAEPQIPWSGQEDLNLRPHGPEPCALTRLSYAPGVDAPNGAKRAAILGEPRSRVKPALPRVHSVRTATRFRPKRSAGARSSAPTTASRRSSPSTSFRPGCSARRRRCRIVSTG